MSPRTKLTAGAAGAAALTLSGLAIVAVSPAHADVDVAVAVPYSQDWSDPDLIANDDDWSGVEGVEGYLGTDLTSANDVDARTVLADGSGVPGVLADRTGSINGVTNGGVIEALDLGAIALQGSGSANAPHLVFHLDLTDRDGVSFSFVAKDLDGSGDDAVQQVAVQYRVGASGEYTDLPDGYIADATTGGEATQETPVSVALPSTVDGEGSVFVRVLTTNATGNDEWVGIDDIVVAEGTAALAASAPTVPELRVDTEMTPLQLAATGGTEPYAWEITAGALPDGVDLSATGELSGTPTETGDFTATATVTDDEDATAAAQIAITVAPAPTLTPIADVQGTPETQGTGAASPLVGEDVIVEGIVTGVYADPYDAEPGMTNYGGLDGFYLQTAGTGGTSDLTPDASDGLFVYTGNDLPAGLEIGDSVAVQGEVNERFGTTRLIDPIVEELDSPLAAVTALEIAYPTTESGREAQEGMLLAPTDTFTVTNNFTTNRFGEVGLATGDQPLIQPTDVARPGTPELDAVVADNAARGVVLDDGTSIDYLSNGSAQQDFPAPWLTPSNPVRVGASATLNQPVILNYDFKLWRFQPQTPVLDDGSDVVTFEDTRADNLEPQDVGGDLKLATFNVLNYFNTTGEDFVENGGTCSYYTDRDENPIANDECNPNGPRGAADEINLERQQAKIVNAINTMDADVVTLEELENSIKLLTETDRDDAISALVDALNTDAGSDVWDFVPSPAEALTAENVDEQDVIRNGFIYRPSAVELVGESDLLFGTTAFANAREPLAQVFKPVGGADESEFAVVVNHFKSKGSGDDDGTGQGNANPDRVAQAEALVGFVDDFQTERGVDKVFLTGDFNAYTEEDPMHVLYDAGFDIVESDQDGDWSYSFSGLSGSLDHVLANEAAMETVDGADVWEINANESVAYQYSRFNYNVTQLYDDSVFAASDHNPEIVGFSPEPDVTPTDPTDPTTGPTDPTTGPTDPTTGPTDPTTGPTDPTTGPTDPEPAEPTVTGGAVTVRFGEAVDVPISVSADGVTPTGTVTLTWGEQVLGTATLTEGSAVIRIPAQALDPRSTPYPLTVAYSGDAQVDPGVGVADVQVDKGAVTLRGKTRPGRIVQGRSQVKVMVRVINVDGVRESGTVTAQVGRRTREATVRNGTVTIRLGKFAKVGRKVVRLRYSGSDLLEPAGDRVSFRVVAKKRRR